NSYPAIEKWVHCHLAAWEARDTSTIAETLHPKIQFVLPTIHLQGRDKVQAALATHLAHYSALRFHVRHLLIDPTQQVAAVEWMGRYIQPDKDGCQKFRGGRVLVFDEAGLIAHWRPYLDPVRRRTVASLDVPLPGEGWSPCPHPGPPLPPAV